MYNVPRHELKAFDLCISGHKEIDIVIAFGHGHNVYQSLTSSSLSHNSGQLAGFSESCCFIGLK